MMFTPFVFIPHWFTWGLLGLSLLLLFRWEITYRLHPERFSDVTNASVSCRHCTEKLCKHKKQLRRFMAHEKERFKREKERLKQETERIRNKLDRK